MRETPALTARNIIGFRLGDAANNFAFAMGALFLLNYYTDVAGLPTAATGTMLLVVRVFDAFADVFSGWPRRRQDAHPLGTVPAVSAGGAPCR